MIFSSYSFIFFFIIFLIVYQFSSVHYRSKIIFLSNFIFYSFFNFYISIGLFLHLLMNYLFMSIFIKKDLYKKNLYLFFCIIYNLFFLFYFKYYNFFIENINFFFKPNFAYADIILPIGISFFTFQLISYYIDEVKNKNLHDFVSFSNYILFFPQLIAGPLIRSKQIIHKFSNLHNINHKNFLKGFKFFTYGLFLKVVLADNLHLICNQIQLGDLSYLSSIDIMTSSYLFGFQIYFDFSGYCLMAVGLAKCINIDIPTNFNFPFFSNNIQEFWKRWNITLGTWIRDYIYVPLIKSFNVFIKKKNLDSQDDTGISYILSLFITWILMGIWHGASWNFVLWGLYHFSYIIIFRFFLKKLKFQYLLWPIHINIIMLSWLIFFVDDLSVLVSIFTNLFSFDGFYKLNMNNNYYLIGLIITFSSFIVYFFRNFFFVLLINKNNFFIFFFFGILNYFSLIYLNVGVVPFIYFQF